jgi:hypothetical protein
LISSQSGNPRGTRESGQFFLLMICSTSPHRAARIAPLGNQRLAAQFQEAYFLLFIQMSDFLDSRVRFSRRPVHSIITHCFSAPAAVRRFPCPQNPTLSHRVTRISEQFAAPGPGTPHARVLNVDCRFQVSRRLRRDRSR